MIAAQGGFIAADGAAFGASVDDDELLFGIGDRRYRLQLAVTLTGAVARIFVDVKRPETLGTVIAGGVTERRDLGSAVRADESVIVF